MTLWSDSCDCKLLAQRWQPFQEGSQQRPPTNPAQQISLEVTEKTWEKRVSAACPGTIQAFPLQVMSQHLFFPCEYDQIQPSWEPQPPPGAGWHSGVVLQLPIVGRVRWKTITTSGQINISLAVDTYHWCNYVLHMGTTCGCWYHVCKGRMTQMDWMRWLSRMNVFHWT